jgi:hypothetical protein
MNRRTALLFPNASRDRIHILCKNNKFSYYLLQIYLYVFEQFFGKEVLRIIAYRSKYRIEAITWSSHLPKKAFTHLKTPAKNYIFLHTIGTAYLMNNERNEQFRRCIVIYMRTRQKNEDQYC